MKRTLGILLIFFSLDVSAQDDLQTIFEKSNGLETPTYQEGITYFQKLANSSEYLQMKEMGPTDSGFPLHLVIFSASRNFDIAALRREGKYFMLVNNAIHPGEPDGVDASMLFLRELTKNSQLRNELKDVVIAVIPFYNIGGMLNRNSTTRINQVGPESYGFRGNAENLDLNRDFIKIDSKNARSFTEIFHLIDPDLFVDNHVSDGADFQHKITLIATQHNRLGGRMGDYLHDHLVPGLYDMMKKIDYDLVPYVHVFNSSPDQGFPEFMDSPRYSSGYAALFQAFSFIIETHSLKPFKERVIATYELNKAMARYIAVNGQEMRELKMTDRGMFQKETTHTVDWRLDRGVSSKLMFKGYESTMVPSEVTGQPRLTFDHSKPYEKEINFYDTYRPSREVEVPSYYVIPQGWHQVIERFQWNGVQMKQIGRDSSLIAQVYTIKNYRSGDTPFEGHHLNRSVSLESKDEKVSVRKGDYIVPVRQENMRYIVETLEPEGGDSFFVWNFFDTILQQKEYFSPYYFEDIAPKILADNPELKEEFDAKKSTDSTFAANAYMQLDFIYQHSQYREKNFMRYPVYRIK